MKTKYYVLIAFVVVSIYSLFTYASILEQPVDTVKPENHKPLKAVEIFFNAVDRGELIVFDQKLDKSILIPIRVEYVYELDGSMPTIKIYSEMRRSIPIPDHVGIKLRGISAFLDSVGRIIEVRAHVIPE